MSDTTQLIEFALQNPNITSLSLAYDCWQEGKYTEPKTQITLEKMLESGLESREPDIARMAAHVKLSRRLNNLYNIDDDVAIDLTYITYAEYQLFVDEQLNSQTHFDSGNAKKPISLSYQNAVKFCAWLNLNTIFLANYNDNIHNGYYYRLPTENEVQNISAREYRHLKCWTMRAVDSQEKGIRVVKAKIPAEYEKLSNYLAAAEWEKASKETAEIMLKAINQEGAGEFNVSAIKQIPCSCISEIDYFWRQYSIGNYGWGVRQNIKNFPNYDSLPFYWLNISGNLKEAFDALVEKYVFCGLESTSTFSFDLVTFNPQGQEIQWLRCQGKYFVENLGNNITLDMVAIPGGSFNMGASRNENGSTDYERPQHQVTVQPFLMGKYPITQAQWKAVATLPKVNRDLKPEPSDLKGDNLPVENVSWYDAVEFCDRLSLHTGKQYCLPSEAEWEYACRAGTTTPFHFGETITGELANYNASNTFADEPKGEFRKRTTPVGEFPPNAFGLYDMHGNLWEWCLDDWHYNYENAPTDGSAWFDDNDNLSQKQGIALLRGGSWNVNPGNCRSASRNFYYRAERVSILDTFGFRIACGVGSNPIN